MYHCEECRRLEEVLEKTALDWFRLAAQVPPLADAERQTSEATVSLRDAENAMNEAQNQLNEHRSKHAQGKQNAQTA